MKPTEQQVREWIAQIKSDSGEAYTQDLCELAARWGAEQAQQTTEPELPEPFGYLSVHKVEGPFKYQFNKERAAVYPDNAISIDAVFTAAQMHDHFAAGVRAGMARGQTLQALQRGFEKVLADPEKHGLDLGEKQ